MGHSKASKAITHARLVQAAASRFKEFGIDGISLSDLMKELQLTHGGFYKHFESRDALVAQALALALEQSGAAMRERLFGGGEPDVAAFADFYLGDSHRNSRAGGCAVAALAGDAARKSAQVQAQFHDHIESNLRILSQALAEDPAGEKPRARAVILLSELYGALMMARAVGDSALSREILRTVRERIVNLAGAPRPRRKARNPAPKARAPRKAPVPARA